MHTERVTLQRRRGWARVEAAVACLIGVTVFALTAAALVMIVIGAIARTWSWLTNEDYFDVPVWSVAPGGAIALAGLTVVVSFGGAFWHFWRGSETRVLREIGAAPLNPERAAVVYNVVEALSIGLGVQPPRLWVCDDPVPNAISARSSRSWSLCVTSGCEALPRDELEALCAHELAHLSAADAHWVSSGMVALARARRFGSRVLGLGIVLIVLVGLVAHYVDIFLWSTGLVAVLLIVLGTLSHSVLRKLELSVRHHADEIADVVAIKLARNPSSLGSLCARLAANAGRVRRTGWRSELLWFEAVEAELESGGVQFGGEGASNIAAAMGAEARGRSELVKRAVAAYAEARLPLPPAVQALF